MDNQTEGAMMETTRCYGCAAEIDDPARVTGGKPFCADCSATEECAYCGRHVPAESSVPLVQDDRRWAEIAGEHAPGCEWALSRAHRTDGDLEWAKS